MLMFVSVSQGASLGILLILEKKPSKITKMPLIYKTEYVNIRPAVFRMHSDDRPETFPSSDSRLESL